MIPDNDKYTWIKANPTFEGLKQVIYEPFDRVKIQKNIPEEKTPYLVIDKVRFIDRSNAKYFTSSWIEFNQNLNVIIGGKSSGKSLLLYHIAKTVDDQQVGEKLKVLKSSGYDPFIKDKPFDFEVVWKNKDIDKLNESNKKGLITYIPQL